ncbi:MAG: GGDEF domain-containing protein [Bauldia sp.]
MNLDIQTLTWVGAFVALLAGLLLLVAWTQIARAPALLWWAAANFAAAAGIALIAVGHTVASHTVVLGGVALIVFGPALVWGGTRRFASRSIPPALLFGGLVAWLLVIFVPLPETDYFIRTAFGFVPAIVYLWASAHELWRGRREMLPARWALIAMFALHGVTFLGGVFDTIAGRFTAGALPVLATWFGLISFESLIYSMGTAVFMAILVKERSEMQIVLASRKDSLTGIANRGALLDGSKRLLERCRQEGASFSLIMFDLDHFKWVNDTYGHAAGDEVIRVFSQTTQGILRPNDLFGRLGGEEFVVVLPRATIEAAYVIADRIRAGFAATAVIIGDEPVKVTASAGVASATSSAMTLDAIMKIADGCLYRAKELGRNRVERPAKTDAEPTAGTNVIRVA